MSIDLKGKTYRNMQEQVQKNAEDIIDLRKRIPYEDEFYTMDETDEKFATIESVDEKDGQVLQDAKDYTDEQVSGTNDGTNWTSITIGDDTYDIPQKSELNNYKANILISATGYATLCIEVPITEDYVSLSGSITKAQLEALLKDTAIAYGNVSGSLYSFITLATGGVVGTYEGNTHLLPASYILVMASPNIEITNIAFQVYSLAVSLSDLESASATYTIYVYNY